MLALYRKYRPRIFSDVAGQPHITITLQNEIRLKRIAHAYLFTGPRGTGKTSTARIFSAALNCTREKGGEPCGECDACVQIKQGLYTDLIEIDAASQTGVDNVRENIIEHARFLPQRGAYKIFIIDEAHMLSTSAWNALLKTLEEPPAHTVFILATTEVKKIPDTIVSRCQYFRFKPIDHDTMVKRLQYIVHEEKVAVDDKTISEIALRAGGFVRDAESLLGMCLSSGLKKITWGDVESFFDQSPLDEIQSICISVFEGDSRRALHTCQALNADGIGADTVLTDLFAVFRALTYHFMTQEMHPLFLKQHGSRGEVIIKILRAHPNATADASLQSLHALIPYTERGRTMPGDLLLEMAVADLTKIYNSPEVQPDHTPDQNTPVPSAPKKQEKKNEVEKPLPQKKSAGIKSETLKKGKEEKEGREQEATAPKTHKAKTLLTLAQIETAWKEIINALREKSSSLSLMLSFAKLLSMEGSNILKLGFSYQFHFDQLSQEKNRLIVEQSMEFSLNTQITIKPILLGKDQPGSEVPQEESLLHNVMDFFGGKVVES